MEITLISGATSGIGYETAKYFIENGTFVVGIGRSEKDSFKLTKNYKFLKLDLANEKNLHDLPHQISELLKSEFKIKNLINNAGIYKTTSANENDYLNWKQQFEINLFAHVNITEQLIPFLTKNSSIVNISSTLSTKPGANNGGYSASKAAMNCWTQSLALRLAPHTRVNCICPGIVNTPIHQIKENELESQLKIYDTFQPLKRVGRPIDIAKSIFFISENSDWMTGAIINLDGGINLV